MKLRDAILLSPVGCAARTLCQDRDAPNVAISSFSSVLAFRVSEPLAYAWELEPEAGVARPIEDAEALTDWHPSQTREWPFPRVDPVTLLGRLA